MVAVRVGKVVPVAVTEGFPVDVSVTVSVVVSIMVPLPMDARISVDNFIVVFVNV